MYVDATLGFSSSLACAAVVVHRTEVVSTNLLPILHPLLFHTASAPSCARSLFFCSANKPLTVLISAVASVYRILQAVVIISILLQFLNKIDRQDLKPAVWKGAFVGMFGAIAVGIAFIIAFYEAGEQFFTGRTEYIVEAILVRLKCSSGCTVNTPHVFLSPHIPYISYGSQLDDYASRYFPELKSFCCFFN